jgi:hypothetical protein
MKMHKFGIFALLVVAWGCSSRAQGAIIARYEITGSSLAATTVDPNATAGNITPSPTVNNQLTSVLTFVTGVGYPAASEPAIGAQRANTTEANTPANVYFSFTVSANPGMNLSSLAFNAAKGGGANPRVYDVLSSVDAFATSLTGGPVTLTTQRPNFTPVSVNLSAAPFQGLSSITFRVHFFTPDPTQNVDFDDITLNGTVIPEPTSLALVLLGLGGIGGVGRRGWLPRIRK